MSTYAMTWAMKQETGCIQSKCLLLVLADRHESDRQEFASIAYLAKLCETSRSTLKRQLKNLVDRGLIRIENRTRNGEKLTSIYHLNMQVQREPTQVQSDPYSPSSVSPPSLKNKTHDQNRPSLSLVEREEQVSSFDDWWKLYPRKVGKQKCQRFWASKKLDAIADQMIEKLQEQVEYQYSNSEPRFIPHPYTYLNQGRWEDEVERPQQTKAKSPDCWEEDGEWFALDPRTLEKVRVPDPYAIEGNVIESTASVVNSTARRITND